MKKLESAVVKRRGIRPESLVVVSAGNYKHRSYKVAFVKKNGYVALKDLQLLNSKRKSYNHLIHHSNLILK